MFNSVYKRNPGGLRPRALSLAPGLGAGGRDAETRAPLNPRRPNAALTASTANQENSNPFGHRKMTDDSTRQVHHRRDRGYATAASAKPLDTTRQLPAPVRATEDSCTRSSFHASLRGVHTSYVPRTQHRDHTYPSKGDARAGHARSVGGNPPVHNKTRRGAPSPTEEALSLRRGHKTARLSPASDTERHPGPMPIKVRSRKSQEKRPEGGMNLSRFYNLDV